MERSKLVVTREELVKIENALSNTDVIEASTKEQANTKSKFYKQKNVNFFEALIREVPMGCKDAILPGPPTKNHTVNCLTYEEITREPTKDNLCPFTALAFHLHGIGDLEKKLRKYSHSS